MLAVVVFVGGGINYVITINRLGPAVLQSTFAGGVLLNVLKEELPEESKGSYWAFALGSGAYAVLLVAINSLP